MSVDVPAGRVLVVDDDPLNRMLLTRSLEQQGHRVDSAVNGLEALEVLREKPFDVVLLDIVVRCIEMVPRTTSPSPSIRSSCAPGSTPRWPGSASTRWNASGCARSSPGLCPSTSSMMSSNERTRTFAWAALAASER